MIISKPEQLILDPTASELEQFKKDHYQEIFKYRMHEVYDVSHLRDDEKKYFVRTDNGRIVGSVILKKDLLFFQK